MRSRGEEIYEAAYHFGSGVLVAVLGPLVLLAVISPLGFLSGTFGGFIYAVACALAFALGIGLQDRVLGRSPAPSRRRCIGLGIAHVILCAGAAIFAYNGGAVALVPFILLCVLGPVPLAVLACWGYTPIRGRK